MSVIEWSFEGMPRSINNDYNFVCPWAFLCVCDIMFCSSHVVASFRFKMHYLARPYNHVVPVLLQPVYLDSVV
jgi:hypothetical protein